MNISDLSLTILIILIFILLLVFNILSVGINKIKADWPLYRCNPAVMPFASVFGQDTATNFTYCIQTMQANYMSFLLQPLHYNLSSISGIGASITNSLNDVRAFFNKIREFITNIVTSIFAVFLNILIEFQRLTINIKDLFNKLIGIMATLMYTLDGSIMTMNSAWDGPPGQLTRKICFHPDTKLRLRDNSLVCIKDVPLNAILKDGTVVHAVMHISNLDAKGEYVEALYKMKGGELDVDVLVTGSHLVYEPTTKKFMQVENLAQAEKTDLASATLTCLITSNHIIPIGQWYFHDWEDNNGSASKSL
jgi:hypothetical protein